MYITKVLEARRTVGAPDVVKPVGLLKFLCCPVQLLLRNGSGQTKLGTPPVWTHSTLRSKVNQKVKVGTKKFFVIRLDDFNAVADNKSPSGSVFLIRSYLVVKKEVDKEGYHRWTSQINY
jgi:hypothetical protein